ncbi:hypothetical protein ACQ4PT_020356 [Festuca glaucescens]
MQSAKEFTLRRFPKLSRWIFTEAEVDYAAAGSGLQVFSLGLNKRLADDAGRSGNLVYSPMSVYAALSLVATGARERTLEELLGVLCAPSRDALADHVRSLAGQALTDWSHTDGPRLEEAAKEINSWVAKSTNKLIPSIIGQDALSPLTDLVLANAIYFKGRWEEPFDKKNTKEDKFHRLDGTDVDVPFMRGFGTHRISCHDGFKVLQLRYQRGWQLPAQPPAPVYSMCVFLPDARDGLWRLADKMSSSPDFLHQHLPRSGGVPVDDLRLPKFKLSFNKDMTSVLQELGLKEAFDLAKADLYDMAEDGAAEGRRRLALQSVIRTRPSSR